MSGKKHDRRHNEPSPGELKSRAERAAGEGRYQQALDLAKQVYKAQPTPANLELLKEMYLGRGRQQRSAGQLREAAATLEAAARIDEGNVAWMRTVATEIARCGDPTRSLALLEKLPEEERGSGVMGPIADGAVVAGSAAQASLPPTLHADLERVVTAFKQVQQGDDEGAKATLQGIGLRSPFLEWKLLLRGLQAFYHNDDARALENWQRLDPERIPARLAAPFRARLDPSWSAQQPPETQGVLQKQYARLQGSGLMEPLRQLRASLAAEDKAASAFRQAEALLPTLRQEAPDLAARLANVFYWHIFHGGPDNIPRFKRVFGAPHDDPNFNRIQAISYDRAGSPASAHRHWQLYEQELAANPSLFGSQTSLARGLIWQKMGQLASGGPSAAQLKRLPEFLREQLEQLERPESLKPDAEECYKRSLELAPDLKETYRSLFDHHREAEQEGKAEQAARKLLERFPDDVETLVDLANMRHAAGEIPEALELFQRALRHNPLDRDLRGSVGRELAALARQEILTGKFDNARQHLERALEMVTPNRKLGVQCLQVVLEMKAGQAEKAAALRQELQASAPAPMLTFLMLSEGARVKLPAAMKKPLDKEFNETIGKKPTDPKVVAALIGCLAGLDADRVEYYGYKTHHKKIVTYVGKATSLKFDAPSLLVVVSALLEMGLHNRTLESFHQKIHRDFPTDPELNVLALDIDLRMATERQNFFAMLSLGHEVERVEKLVEKMPQGERREALHARLGELRKVMGGFQALSGLGGMGGMPFNPFQILEGFFDEDDFDDDDYDD